MRKTAPHLARENVTEVARPAHGVDVVPSEGAAADPRAQQLVREMSDENDGRVGLWGYTFEARSAGAVEAFLRLGGGVQAFFDRGAVRVNFGARQASSVALVALNLGLEPIGNVSRG